MNFYYIWDGHVPEHMYNQRLNSRYQFSYHVDSGDQIQVTRLGSKHLYPLRLRAGPPLNLKAASLVIAVPLLHGCHRSQMSLWCQPPVTL